jgi:hypothetical protein
MCLGIGIALLPAFVCAATRNHAAAEQHVSPHACDAAPIVPGQAWEFEYSFTGSIVPGVGTVRIVLPSTGDTTVTTKYREDLTHVKHVHLPPNVVAKIAKVLSKWPPACIHTLVRKGYYVADIGRTEIKFTTGARSTTAVVGPCRYVDNGEAFQAIYDAVASLKPYFGDAATWSAMMYTPIKGDACKAQGPAPNISSKRTRGKSPRAT